MAILEELANKGGVNFWQPEDVTNVSKALSSSIVPQTKMNW